MQENTIGFSHLAWFQKQYSNQIIYNQVLISRAEHHLPCAPQCQHSVFNMPSTKTFFKKTVQEGSIAYSFKALGIVKKSCCQHFQSTPFYSGTAGLTISSQFCGQLATGMQSLLYINGRCKHCFAGYNYSLNDTILKIIAFENLPFLQFFPGALAWVSSQ